MRKLNNKQYKTNLNYFRKWVTANEAFILHMVVSVSKNVLVFKVSED